MSVPATADDLVLLIRKSGLVDERKLTAFLNSHQKDGLLTSEPKKVVATMVREGLLTFFQGEQYLLGKWRGFTLGKFKLLERIGVGGMGQVFLCEHTFMRKRMAVKVLPPTKAEDPVSLGRFYREARVASGLEHPNIVRTFDIDQDGPLHFLVMEYMDGTSLLEIVKRFGPMNVGRACHYIRQACIGLQYAHSRGMIHRDIKPGNILVDRQGVAKLLDMGLARFYRDEQDQLTLKYADIYGMGATFYYVLAGQPPFPEATMAEKLIAHQSKSPKPLRELRPDIPQGVARIIDKMMAKDPKDRYQTPQEVVDALEVWTQQPIDPPPADEMPRLSPAATEAMFATAKTAQPAPAAAPVAPAAVSPAPPRSEEKSPARPTSSRPASASPAPADYDRDIEEGVTVPVPLGKTPTLASIRQAGSESLIDLVGMVGGRQLGASARPIPAPAEARPVPAAESTPVGPNPHQITARPVHEPAPPPAPKPAAATPVEPPRLPLHPSVHGLPPRPSAPGDGLRPSDIPISRESAGKSSPGVELPKLRSFHGTAPAPATKPEGGPLRPSSLGSFQIQPPASAPAGDIHRTPSGLADSGLSASTGLSSTPLRHARASSNTPLRRSAVPISPPAYKPPTMVPYFDQPIASPNPKFGSILLRWILILGVSLSLGAALAVAIWLFRHTAH
jgi:eukaryotic-like serine/threonine-protein kinase